MAQGSDLLKSVTGRYWVYDNSVWDSDHKVIYTFLERVNEGQVIAKGSGFYFDDNGSFQEVADPAKIGGKPCSGNWEDQGNNMLKVTCGGKVWHYHILEIKEGAMVLSITSDTTPHAQKKDKASFHRRHRS